MRSGRSEEPLEGTSPLYPRCIPRLARPRATDRRCRSEAEFVNVETGEHVTLFQKNIERVDAAPVPAKYGAVIVLTGGKAIPVRETPTEVRGRFGIGQDTRKIVTE